MLQKRIIIINSTLTILWQSELNDMFQTEREFFQITLSSSYRNKRCAIPPHSPVQHCGAIHVPQCKQRHIIRACLPEERRERMNEFVFQVSQLNKTQHDPPPDNSNEQSHINPFMPKPERGDIALHQCLHEHGWIERHDAQKEHFHGARFVLCV